MHRGGGGGEWMLGMKNCRFPEALQKIDVRARGSNVAVLF